MRINWKSYIWEVWCLGLLKLQVVLIFESRNWQFIAGSTKMGLGAS
jgi:hypothetical protein